MYMLMSYSLDKECLCESTLHYLNGPLLTSLIRHHKWPQIPGLHDFEGHITHSANWQHDYDYSHKRIAVIGNGSSGIQIVPQMQKLPGTDVTNFMRGPTWVYYRVPPSKHLGREVDDPNPAYTDEERRNWRENPDELRKYRKAMINRTNKAFKMVNLNQPPRFYPGADGSCNSLFVAPKERKMQWVSRRIKWRPNSTMIQISVEC
jgi:cation diffusion facilitator CzcD-associated flavoprotein CzcO